MVVKLPQTNFTSGVLDPALAAREDITFFYNGLKDGVNGIIQPQGGFKARPGLQNIQEIAGVLSENDLSTATVTAPEGGTAANAHDGDPATLVTTTGDIGTTDPFVVLHVDFGAAVDISAVDVVNYSLETGSLSDEFFIQYSTDDASWNNYGTAFDWDASERSRRRRDVSGDVTARYWRLARIGATATAAKANVGLFRFWQASGSLSDVRLLPFAYSTDEAYMTVATDKNLDILVGTEYACSAGIPHESTNFRGINWTQSLDTMLLFHKDIAPQRIFRQGDDDEFDFRAQSFSNIPSHDYGAGTGGTNEVQTLNDGATLSSGDKFTILLEGERTTTITAGGSRAASATAIQTALRALSNTSSDGITVTDASGDGFAVTFAGDDGVQPWDSMSVSVLNGNSVWSTSRTTKGEYPGEPLMSTTRGYPRAGLFIDSRLAMGGVPGVPDALMMSVVGDYYNLDITSDLDTKGLLFRAETDQVGAIYNLIAGRHLALFSNDGEFFFPNEKISLDNPPKLTTRSGNKEGTRIYEVDGALIFIQGVKNEDGEEIGTSLREFLFVDTEQSYQANLVSKLSSHLIINPIDMALRKALSTNDADILAIVNEDGTGTNYTVLRGDAVNALIPFRTRDGDKLLAVGVDKNRRVYFAVERVINGTTRRFLEKWNEDLLLDGGGLVTISGETTTATADQTVFSYTFTSPGSADAVGVRVDGGRLAPEEYTVDLGAKTVTLNDGVSAGVQVRITLMQNSVSGLDHLEGETVLTVIDGTEGGSYTVTSGVLTLDDYADTEIQYGFDFEVSGTLMPLRVPETETLANELINVINVTAILRNTGGIQIRANGVDKWHDMPLRRLDSNVLDRSTAELLFTGEASITGLSGFAIGAPVEFRRPGPVPFNVLGIVREVTL
jgi:hypothetical protein